MRKTSKFPNGVESANTSEPRWPESLASWSPPLPFLLGLGDWFASHHHSWQWHVLKMVLCVQPRAFPPNFKLIFTTPYSRYFHESHFRRKETRAVNVPKVRELVTEAVTFWTVFMWFRPVIQDAVCSPGRVATGLPPCTWFIHPRVRLPSLALNRAGWDLQSFKASHLCKRQHGSMSRR